MGLWKERIWEDMTHVIQILLARVKEINFIYQYTYFILLIKPQYTKSQNR